MAGVVRTRELTELERTETKATTSWPVDELAAVLPRLLHAGIRSSKYYSSRNDAISIQAQTERSRSANTEENREKLYDEVPVGSAVYIA